MRKNTEKINSGELFLHNLRKREEGLKNSEDIFDIANWDEIYARVDEQIKNEQVLIEYDLEEDAGRELLILEVKEFAETTTTRRFREEFLHVLSVYQKERREISSKILNYMEERRFFLPRFLITGGERSKDVLQKLGFTDRVPAKSSALVVFNLPKPLATYWWKGGASEDNKGKDVGASVIEWGHFYRELIPIIWEQIGFYECEGSLDFERINDVHVHKPQDFYYIWEVSQWR